jgi:hypothetical protein
LVCNYHKEEYSKKEGIVLDVINVVIVLHVNFEDKALVHQKEETVLEVPNVVIVQGVNS